MDSVEELRDSIVGFLSRVTGVPPSEIRDESRLAEDLGLDSLARIDVFSAFNEQFRLGLSLNDVAGTKTVGEAVQRIYDSRQSG